MLSYQLVTELMPVYIYWVIIWYPTAYFGSKYIKCKRSLCHALATKYWPVLRLDLKNISNWRGDTRFPYTCNDIWKLQWFLFCFVLRGTHGSQSPLVMGGDGGGRPSSVMSLGVTSVGGHSHGHTASPIGVGSSWEDIDPRSPEPLVVRGGWLWLIWVVRWTT